MRRTRTSWKSSTRGYLYTVAILILMMPLILLILFYTGTEKTKIEDTSASIRCDELYYLVQDVEHDMDRALVIFGRRAAVYAIGYVITNNTPLWNYTYHSCEWNYTYGNGTRYNTSYHFTGNASEAAMAELILCGTLNGLPVDYMINHTMPIWINKINSNSGQMNYNINITLNYFRVVPHDAWNFSLIADMNISVSDKTDLCYYRVVNKSWSATTNIIGLEDPLYPLYTGNRVAKYLYDCDTNIRPGNLTGCTDSDLNTTCYVISNITQYSINPNCTLRGENYPNGPSFFDRLDGNLRLSDKYKNQAVQYYNNPYIGIETLVSEDDLAYYGIAPNTSATWIDYLYWAKKPGCVVDGCAGRDYLLKLDCPHAYLYHLDTGCVNGSRG